MKIWVIHGPNLNLLGVQEKTIYEKRIWILSIEVQEAASRMDVEIFNSITRGDHRYLHRAVGKIDGIIINPGPTPITAMPSEMPSQGLEP